MPKYEYATAACPYCGEVRKSNGLHKHVKTHGDAAWLAYSAQRQKARTYVKQGDVYACLACSFTGPSWQAVAAHTWRAHTESGQEHVAIEVGSRYKKGRNAWNLGLSRDTDARVAQNAIAVSSTVLNKVRAGTYRPPTLGKAARERLSVRQSTRNSGGRCKWFQVNGIAVQGTWERDVAEKLCELGIHWMRPSNCKMPFEYEMDGRKRRYTPDFYLPDFDLYLEVKGFWWGQDKRKMDAVREQHPAVNFTLVQKNELQRLRAGDIRFFAQPAEACDERLDAELAHS